MPLAHVRFCTYTQSGGMGWNDRVRHKHKKKDTQEERHIGHTLPTRRNLQNQAYKTNRQRINSSSFWVRYFLKLIIKKGQ